MTLGQGHPKVTQYIFPDPYFLYTKFLRSSSNGFDVTSKSHCGGGGGGGGRGRGGETNWKHKVTPDWGDLIKLDVIFNNSFWNHNFRLWKFCSFDGGHFIQSSLYPRQYAAAFIIIHGYRGFRKIPQTAVPKGCFSNQWWYGQRSPMHGVTDCFTVQASWQSPKQIMGLVNAFYVTVSTILHRFTAMLCKNNSSFNQANDRGDLRSTSLSSSLWICRNVPVDISWQAAGKLTCYSCEDDPQLANHELTSLY